MSVPVNVSPVPSDEEAVAITAAVEALWPRPTYQVEEAPKRSVAWRFSGRWWMKPVPTRRVRP